MCVCSRHVGESTVRIFIWVYIYACMYTYTHMQAFVQTGISIYTCIHTVSDIMYIDTYICMYTVSTLYIYTYVYLHIHTVCICMMYVCIPPLKPRSSSSLSWMEVLSPRSLMMWPYLKPAVARPRSECAYA